MMCTLFGTLGVVFFVQKGEIHMEWDFKTNGHYFFNDDERGGSSCDIEFQKGRFSNVFHKEDSMYLWDDHFWILDITTLFVEVLPEFDMCTVGCEINEEQWAAIVEASKKYSQITQQIVAEMNPWMRDTIGEYGCVTVLGV